MVINIFSITPAPTGPSSLRFNFNHGSLVVATFAISEAPLPMFCKQQKRICAIEQNRFCSIALKKKKVDIYIYITNSAFLFI